MGIFGRMFGGEAGPSEEGQRDVWQKDLKEWMVKLKTLQGNLRGRSTPEDRQLIKEYESNIADLETKLGMRADKEPSDDDDSPENHEGGHAA